MKDSYGTPPRRLRRRKATDTSIVASETVNTFSWEGRMHNLIRRCGTNGCTPKEALEVYPDAPYSTVTARFAALKRKGLVFDSGYRRERSAVLVAHEHKEAWEAL